MKLDPTIEALIPHQAEQGVLGYILLDPKLHEKCGGLKPEHFGVAVHADIYERLVAEIDAGRTPTPLTLARHFRDDDRLKNVGGMTYLNDLLESVLAFPGSPVGLARQIIDGCKARQLVRTLDDIKARAVKGAEEGSSLASALDSALEAALSEEGDRAHLWTASELFEAVITRHADEADGKLPRGVRSQSLPDFAGIVGGGMRAGDVTILAGRPGMGKTAVAMSVASGAAALGHGTLFISLEVSDFQIGDRLVCDILFEGLHSPTADDIKNHKLSSGAVRRGAELAAERPLRIIAPSKATVGDIATEIRRTRRLMEAKGHKLELVVIDYLQLIKSDRKTNSIYEAVTYVSQAVKELAKRHNVAILALAQVNRGVESRQDKRPLLGDLRESGSIEQDADNVVYLYRDEYYLKQCEPDPHQERDAWEKWSFAMQQAADRIEIYSAKVRHGAEGRFKGYFFLRHQAVRGSRFFGERDQ